MLTQYIVWWLHNHKKLSIVRWSHICDSRPLEWNLSQLVIQTVNCLYYQLRKMYGSKRPGYLIVYCELQCCAIAHQLWPHVPMGFPGMKNMVSMVMAYKYAFNFYSYFWLTHSPSLSSYTCRLPSSAPSLSTWREYSTTGMEKCPGPLSTPPQKYWVLWHTVASKNWAFFESS